MNARIETGSNYANVFIGNLQIAFSYETVIAFSEDRGGKTFVSENLWGPTTGKHLKAIDGGRKAERLPRADFEDAFGAMLKAHKLA